MTHSNSLFQWQRIKRFNLTIWTILIGTLISRTTYFMAWPYLIVVMTREYHATEMQIGLMLASSVLVGALTGLYSGYLSDKIGRKTIMFLGAMIAGFAYGGIGLASQIWHFYLLLMLAGLMRPMLEAPSKALISDHLDDRKDRELAQNIRYFLLNAGGAIGPLIGITLALADPQALFFATGFVYFLYGFALLLIIQSALTEAGSSAAVPNFIKTIAIISRDSVFIKLMLANFLMLIVYAQLESTIQQIIVRGGIVDAATLIAGLVLTNTLTIIILQFPLLRVLEHLSLFVRARIGMCLMGLSQLIFMLIDQDSVIGWYIAVFVISLGEVVAFPTLNVQIDRLAPANLRGAYFGAAALYSLGEAVAPILGALIIAYLLPSWLFAVCFLFSLAMVWLYWLAEMDWKTKHLQD